MANRRPLVIIDGVKHGIGPGDNLDIASGQSYNVGGEPHTHDGSPVSVTINRTDGEISSLEFEGGKTVTINRVDGEIASVADGTHTWSINRVDGEITQIIVT